MTPYRLVTLGRLELVRDGAPVLARRRKELGLLVFLARRGPRPVDRVRLAAMLWGSSGNETRARGSLRQSLFDLREVGGDLIQADHESVRIDPRTVDLDLAEFETAIAAGRLEQAVALWGGPFLDGLEDLGDDSWMAWVEAERTAARAKVIVALNQLCDFAVRSGDGVTAIRWAERLRDLAPHDENAAVRLTDLFLQAGRAADARAEIDRVIDHLRRDLGAEPGPVVRGVLERLERNGGGSRIVRALLSPELVGREAIVTALAGAADAVRTGAGRSVIIEGDRGTGKSRIVEAFAADGSPRGQLPVWLGRAFAAEQAVPWSALRPVLARAMSDSPGVSAVPPEVLAAAAVAVPELRERFAVGAATGSRPAEAVVRVLSEMASDRPLALIVDDAVDADAASADVLVALARRPPPGLLLVLTGQPTGWAAAPLGIALAEATTVERHAMGPLSGDEIGHLLGSMAPFDPASRQRLAERIRGETGGIPGTVVQRIRVLASAGVIGPGPSGTWEIRRDGALTAPGPSDPPGTDLPALPATTRRLVETAARLGPAIDPALLRREAGLDPEAHEEALGSALAVRLLRESSIRPGRLEFESEATRREFLGGPARDRTGRRWRLPAAAIVAVAAMLAIGGWLWRDRTSARVAAGTPVLVATLRNDTGDPSLGGLQTAAEVGLLETGHVWLLPRPRIAAALRRAGRDSTEAVIAGDLAREIALRENVPLVIEFRVDRPGGAYLVTGRVVAAATGEDLRAFAARAGGPDGILPALGSVVRRIRGALGSVDPPGGAADLPAVTTRSLAALRAYADGEAAWNEGQVQLAATHLEQAVQLDSTFAMAHLLLARYALRVRNDRPAAAARLEAAARWRTRLTGREQLVLDFDAAQLAGRTDRAIDLARVLATRFPTPATVGTLANALFRAGRCPDALPVFRRAIGMAPGNTALLINLATCLQLTDSLDAALGAYADVDRVDPNVLLTGNLNHEWGGAFVRSGRLAEAESVFRRMAARPAGVDRARARRSLGYLDLTRGAYRSALAHFSEASLLFQREGVALSAVRSETMAAQAAARSGQIREARTHLKRAESLTAGLPLDPVYPLYLGSTHLIVADPAGARQWLSRLDRIVGPGGAADSALRNLLAARIALAEGRRDQAAVLLPVRWPAALNQHAVAAATTRGYLQWAAGHADSAVVSWQPALGERPWGFELQDEWERLPLALAEAHLATGDSAAARAVLTPLAQRWKDAPAPFPELDRLRRLQARLGATPGR